MRLPLSLALVFFTCLAADPRAAGQLQQPGRPDTAERHRPHVRRLHPSPRTEVVPDEMWLTTDSAGRRKVTMSGALTNRQLERLFWFVNPHTNTYIMLRLTADDSGDAKRITKVYHDVGLIASEESVIELLRQQRTSAEERERSLKASAKGQVADVTASGALCPTVLTDEEESRDHGPAASESAQWTTRCDGFGWANIQTWEPARYLFDVLHLNETQAAASWDHYEPSGWIPNTRSGSCWANPQTFAGTSWYTTMCRKEFTSSYHSFDWAVTGNYVNFDFSYYVTGVSRWISITSTASVQSTYSQGIWGAQYIEDTQNWLRQWYETFFLSGVIAGEAWEGDCVQYCDPPQSQLDECANREIPGVWDWDRCECTGSSPVLIDLDNDGLALTSALDGVPFDIAATGRRIKLAWTRSDSSDAFLTLDRDGNGTIDSGSELFGNVTEQRQPPKKGEANGFLALAVFDEPASGGNADGQISEEDSVYTTLRLWLDTNHDGVSQPDELRSLAAHGVRAISLHYVKSKRVDEFGNLYRFRSHVTTDRDAFSTGSIKRQAVDVYLVSMQ